MARPDLPIGMGGWQALDGTPQEESKGNHYITVLIIIRVKQALIVISHAVKPMSNKVDIVASNKVNIVASIESSHGNAYLFFYLQILRKLPRL